MNSNMRDVHIAQIITIQFRQRTKLYGDPLDVCDLEGWTDEFIDNENWQDAYVAGEKPKDYPEPGRSWYKAWLKKNKKTI